MFRFISQVFSGMRSCLAWWSSVSEDRAKFLTQFLSHGIVFERAWALSLYRVGMALVALLAAVTGTVE